MHRAGGVDVGVGAVTPSAGVAVDPLQPVLGTVGRYEILQIVDDGDALRLDGPEEIVLDWVCVVAERDLDGALVTVEVTVVRRALVCLVLLHERQELLGGPALGLEVIIVRC